MAYKWSYEQVEERTWPQLKVLLDCISDFPPNDILVGSQVRDSMDRAKNQTALYGLGAKKGKVKRRPVSG